MDAARTFEGHRRDRAIVASCLVGFAAVCWLCLAYHLPRLRARDAALAAASILPEIQARWSDGGRGGLRLTGLVGDAASRASLGERVQALTATGPVVNDIVIGTRLTDVGWMIGAVDVIDAMRRNLPSGLVSINGPTVNLRGEVADDSQRRTLVAEVTRAAAGRFKVLDQLTVGRTPVAVDQSAVFAANLRAALDGRAIEFESDSAVLTSEGRRTLDALLPILQASPAPIEIAGHTDASGRAEVNLRLSTERAEAVRDALIALGVAAGRLRAVGYGASRPVAENDTDDGKRRNRRIEISVLSQEAIR